MPHVTRHGQPVRNGLLAALPAEVWARLEPLLEVVELPFDKTLHVPDDTLQAVLFIETGIVSELTTLEDGQQVEAGLVGPEGLIGLPLIHGVAEAFTETRVQLEGLALRMDAAAFRAEMAAAGPFAARMQRFAMAFLAQLAQTVACNTRHGIEHRLARWLLMVHDRAGRDEFSHTHEFIAMMLGVRRPGVTLAIGAMQRAGLLEQGRGRLTILDRHAIEGLACECYDAVRHRSARLLGPE